MANYIYTQVLNSTFDLVFVVNGAQQNIAKAALGTAGCEVYISDSAGVINPSSTYVTVRNNSGELYIGHVPDITQPTGLTDAQSLVNYINTLLQEVVINGGGGGQPGAGVITFNTRNGNVVLTTADINAAMGVSTSDFQNAVGTTAQQPTAAVGMQRYNSDTGLFEFYNGAWINFATTSSLAGYLPIAGGELTGTTIATASTGTLISDGGILIKKNLFIGGGYTGTQSLTIGSFLNVAASTFTDSNNTTAASWAGSYLGQPTLSTSGTITTGSTLHIPSAPAVTGGGAINSVYALRVGANALFEGGIIQARAVATSSGNANNINTTMTITVANSANTYMNTFSLQTASSGNLTNNTTGGLSAVIGDINAGGTGTVSLAASHVAQLRITAAQAVTEYDGYRVLAPTNAGGGTLAEFNGYKVEDHSIGTVIYGFRGKLSSGTGKFNIYADGTATNYLAGNTGIGVTASASAFVNYGAGTTTVAANLYQNGVLNTVALAGAREYANNHYIANSASIRGTLSIGLTPNFATVNPAVADGTQQTLYTNSYTNLLSTNGDILEFQFSVQFTTSALSKVFQVSYGGVNLTFTSITLTTGNAMIRGMFIRDGSGTVRAQGNLSSAAAVYSSAYTTGSVTHANANALVLSASLAATGALGTITANFGKAWYHPAP